MEHTTSKEWLFIQMTFLMAWMLPRCCSGGDNDGMGLFPGEKELLESSTDFEINDSEGNFGEPVVVLSLIHIYMCIRDRNICFRARPDLSYIGCTRRF